MKLPRRKFLHLAMGATALSALSNTALALDYPTRPVHIIVGFPAGFTLDIIARLTAQVLSQRLGQQVVIDMECQWAFEDESENPRRDSLFSADPG